MRGSIQLHWFAYCADVAKIFLVNVLRDIHLLESGKFRRKACRGKITFVQPNSLTKVQREVAPAGAEPIVGTGSGTEPRPTPAVSSVTKA